MKKEIYRSRNNRKLAGVCSGIAESWGLEPEVGRIFFAGLTLFWGLGIWIYWVLALKLKEKSV